MLNSPSTKRIILLQIVTFGFYFFRWCSVSRREINQVLGRAKIPTTWLVALPAGNYWWMWQYAEGLEAVTRGRLKRSDTFLYYILATCFSLVFSNFGNFNFHSSNSSTDLHLSHNAIIGIVVGILVLVYLLVLTGNTFFICVTQRRIDKARGKTTA